MNIEQLATDIEDVYDVTSLAATALATALLTDKPSANDFNNPALDGWETVNQAVDKCTAMCHEASRLAGWWKHPKSHESYEFDDIFTTKLMLAVSELSEAMEAHRRNKNDDKLPQYPGVIVELIDAGVRIFDLLGAAARHYNLSESVGDIWVQKMVYNARRKDHKIDARNAVNGKRY